MSDERGRGRGPREPAEPGLYDLVDLVARRLVTAIVIAGGLVAFGLWTQDSAEAPDYQVSASADGRVYRVNTDSGSIVGCENNVCALLLRGSDDLADKLPVRAQPALPAPAPAQGNEAAAQPAAQPAEQTKR